MASSDETQRKSNEYPEPKTSYWDIYTDIQEDIMTVRVAIGRTVLLFFLTIVYATSDETMTFVGPNADPAILAISTIASLIMAFKRWRYENAK